MTRPTLFADRGCAFAHRVLATLHQLGIDHERRESAIGHHPEGVLAYSPTGRIPLWVDGDLVLSESRVILEYLAEASGWRAAWPDDLRERARHRHAIEVLDLWLTPWLFGEPSPDVVARLPTVLGALEAVAPTAAGACLLSLHVGPVWLRCEWYGRDRVRKAVEARPALRAWLDDARDMPCVQATAPRAADHLADIRDAVRDGRLPAAASMLRPVG